MALLALLATPGCGEEDAAELTPIHLDMQATVAAGQEAHVCQFVKLPESEGDLFVRGGEYTASHGTHHFLLFRTDPTMAEPPLDEPIDCYDGDGVMQYERGYVTGGQLEHDDADFPDGLALGFGGGAVLLMQSHVVNTTTEAIEATVDVELRRAEPASVTSRVGTFRFYDPFIYLPPAAQARATMRCHIHHDVQLLTAGAHMHARGVGYQAFVDPPGETASEPFYTTQEWQHPDYYVGAIELQAGSAIRFGCDYRNDGTRTVVQGLSADDEMCMLSGFYYPEQDLDEEICVSMDMHGTGTRSCAQTTSCIQLCPPEGEPQLSQGSAGVGACFQKCVVDSCPDVTEALFPQLTCTRKQCADECQAYGPACTSCVASRCKPELDACQALACDE